jgi:hypothetical protein
MKKILKWGGIILIVLIIIGALSGNKGGSNNKTGTSSNNKTNDAQKIASLNETVQDGDLAFTVLAVNKSKTLGNSFSQKTAQGMFYVVTIKIENKGNKTMTFDASMAKVKDDQGREFERSVDGQTAKGLSQGQVDLFLQQIQPSLSVTGDLVFDLPDNLKNPVLNLKGSLFSKGVGVKLE